MLTGAPAFGGNTVVEILSRVLRTDPDWAALPDTTPAGVRALLKRCLQKDRQRRLRDIADARFQFEEALIEPVGLSPAASPRSAHAASFRSRLLMIASPLAALLIGAVAAALYFGRSPAAPPEMRLQIVTPFTDDVTSFAISPDGQKIVFRAVTDGIGRLWLRSFDSETAEPLAGTENGTRPF
ncbi:MAG TPA: hypothetical protein VM818_01165, partial [Vicinamibacterales bacterium]|nr:hypothetical protein [Vicinamibacterales bacterium]